jgi:hypothetical protein
LEEQLLDCWTRVAKEAQVIFDVGANSGIYSLAALASQPNAAILRRYRGDSGENEGMNYITGETGELDVERVQTICLDDFCHDHRIAHISTC